MTDSEPLHERRVLVVGLGSVDRGDDAIGPLVAARVHDAVTACGTVGVRVLNHEDPTALVHVMEGSDVVVIIDAMRSGAAAGTVTRYETGRNEAPLGASTEPGPAGTHGLGLPAAVELARVLDRLPDRVVVVGVEAVDFEHGHGLSAPAANAVPRAVDAVLEIVRGDEWGGPGPLRRPHPPPN